jgi:predicted ATP-grasp superfamily ATP-dependent carboligase
LNVLVTNASYQCTLAIVRCLGRKGVDVYVLGEWSRHGLDPSFHSRYCKERINGPRPRDDEYIDFLAQILKSRNIDVLIPVGYWATEKITENRKKLDTLTHMEIAKVESFRLAANKRRTYELAEDLGIPYPKTIYPQSLDEVNGISGTVKYPVVIKPIIDGHGHPVYARKSRELLDKYREMCEKNPFSENYLPMIQEYIVADSTHDFSALYQNGAAKRVFMWNEIRSYPASGGHSAYSESTYNPTLKEYGVRFLDELGWHGIVDIEFKLDKRDRKFKLMEVNPKIWASIEVAIKAGVDFPYLLCKMANGVQLDYSEKYNRHLKFHWLSRELGHVWQRPSSIPKFVADTFNSEVKSNILPNDLAPNILEFVFPIANRLLRAR